VPASGDASNAWTMTIKDSFGAPLVQMGKILHDIPNIFDESVRHMLWSCAVIQMLRYGRDIGCSGLIGS
ncbi:MAG: hypothetical protein QMB34_02830, partial [Paracoccaceae bacterium]